MPFDITPQERLSAQNSDKWLLHPILASSMHQTRLINDFQNRNQPYRAITFRSSKWSNMMKIPTKEESMRVCDLLHGSKDVDGLCNIKGNFNTYISQAMSYNCPQGVVWVGTIVDYMPDQPDPNFEMPIQTDPKTKVEIPKIAIRSKNILLDGETVTAMSGYYGPTMQVLENKVPKDVDGVCTPLFGYTTVPQKPRVARKRGL